jgi:acyl-CoA synthetase (AMP-forming)/AMP-acid ligase II
MCIWLGLNKIGVNVALVNTNQTHESLLHTFKVAPIKGVILSSSFVEAINEVRGGLPFPPNQVFLFEDKAEGFESISLKVFFFFFSFHRSSSHPQLFLVQNFEDTRPDRSLRSGIRLRDVALYIYTSGTRI